MPIHLPCNQSVGRGAELRRKRFGKEIGLEPRMENTMRQVDSRFKVGAWGQRGAERWTRLIRDPKGMRKFVPQLRCTMPKRTVRLVILRRDWTGGRRRVTKSWPSRTWRLYGPLRLKDYTLLIFLGGIADNDSAYRDICYCSVVCPSVCTSVILVYPAKAAGRNEVHSFTFTHSFSLIH